MVFSWRWIILALPYAACEENDALLQAKALPAKDVSQGDKGASDALLQAKTLSAQDVSADETSAFCNSWCDPMSNTGEPPWEETCRWDGCGQCPECDTTTTTTTPWVTTTGQHGTEEPLGGSCPAWCDPMVQTGEWTWEETCRWDGCGQCSECQKVPDTTTTTPWVTTTGQHGTEEPLGGSCPSWCDHLVQTGEWTWEETCRSESCHQCSECQKEPGVTTTSQQSAFCNSWCDPGGSELSWEDTCRWDGCGQCSECQKEPDTTTQKEPDTTTMPWVTTTGQRGTEEPLGGSCHSWCDLASNSWEDKCQWWESCMGCSPCSHLDWHSPWGFCNRTYPLWMMTSPYHGTTSNGSQTLVTSCGGMTEGREEIFVYRLDPGFTIDIGMPWTNFDSRHETRWGGDCPGVNNVACTDDPNEQRHRWTNNQNTSEYVYFIVDAFTLGQGEFTLSWSVSNGTQPPFTTESPSHRRRGSFTTESPSHRRRGSFTTESPSHRRRSFTTEPWQHRRRTNPQTTEATTKAPSGCPPCEDGLQPELIGNTCACSGRGHEWETHTATGSATATATATANAADTATATATATATG